VTMEALVGGEALARKPLLQRLRRATLGWRPALIEQSPPWACRVLGPLARRLDMLLVDHGIFRLLYLNKHRIGTRAWRSAQPAPHQIRAMARRGLRTVINLRGERACGSYWTERDTCREHGVALVNFQVRSREAPTRETIRAARDLFERVEYPVLMHCKSGADRAGLMSVLYLHIAEQVPIDQARRQLALRFGHFRSADTGILDFIFERYLQDNARTPMPFMEWVDTMYDPVTLRLEFRSKGWANRLVGGVLRRE
jgi:protein tyrosine/serine phosphatase